MSKLMCAECKGHFNCAVFFLDDHVSHKKYSHLYILYIDDTVYCFLSNPVAKVPLKGWT